MARLKMGFVGTGGMARGHLRGLATLKEEGKAPFEVVAACDVVWERAHDFAEQAQQTLGGKCAVYTDYREMLADGKVEAVNLVVHHAGHHEIGIPVMKAKKHLIVEKPLALTPGLGRKMIQAAKKAGVTLCVAENYRFSPWNRALKRAIEGGLVGEVYFALKEFAGVGSDIFCGTPWRHSKALGGAGPIFDNGVHDADLFLYLMGEVDEAVSMNARFEKVRTDGKRRIRPTAEDADATVLRFKSGALGHWFCSWAGHGKGFGLFYLYGSKGCVLDNTVHLDGREPLSSDELVARFAPKVRKDTVASELVDFAEAIRKGRKPEIDGEQGLRAVCVSFAALESALTRQPVKVRDVFTGRAHAYEDTVLEAYQREG